VTHRRHSSFFSRLFSWLSTRTTQGRFDWVSPLALLGLSGIGVAFIYSAQLWAGHGTWQTQVVWLAAGFFVYVAVSLLDYRVWLEWSPWFYLAAIVLLILVLVPWVGTSHFGARRWIAFGKFSLQPSEFVKPAVLLVVAGLLIRSKVGSLRRSVAVLGKLALAAGAPIFLILLQPDLKSAIVLPPMIFAMLYVSRLSARFFAVVLGVSVLLAGLVKWDSHAYVNFMQSRGLSFHADKGAYQVTTWVPLKDYQRNRILAFLSPDLIDEKGVDVAYNLNQSLISVGSGGLTGKGWRQGTQAQLGYLPRAVAHNDFIFSVIAEEKGFLGSLTVLGLFGIVLFNGIRIASLSRDAYGKLIAIGVTTIFAVHVFVNIAMTIGLVPITGIPLPFISYGGSFVLSCCLLQGLVQSVWRFRKDFA
jgi:rod shape determining protein RodA